MKCASSHNDNPTARRDASQHIVWFVFVLCSFSYVSRGHQLHVTLKLQTQTLSDRPWIRAHHSDEHNLSVCVCVRRRRNMAPFFVCSFLKLYSFGRSARLRAPLTSFDWRKTFHRFSVWFSLLSLSGMKLTSFFIFNFESFPMLEHGTDDRMKCQCPQSALIRKLRRQIFKVIKLYLDPCSCTELILVNARHVDFLRFETISIWSFWNVRCALR